MNNNSSQEAIGKLRKYQKIVDKELKFFFKKQLRESKKADKSSYQIIKALEDFNLRGGKRIRAALVFYGFQCFSKKKISKELIRASMAMELVQSCLLIHDDIIDRDELRRGKDTMHKFFEKIGQKDLSFGENINEKEHFGRAMAIFVGDICAALASMVLAEVNFKNKARAIYEMNRVIRDATFGQAIDLRSGYCDVHPKNSILSTLKIYKLKTATYSIEVPLKIGAILANASDKEIEKIKYYAEPLGIAYSIQDDLLGLFSEEEKLGKSIGSDLKEGKKTLIMLKTLERAMKGEIVFIKNNLGNRDMSDKTVKRIKEIMIRTGALDYCTKYARNLILKSKKIVSNQDYQSEGKQFIMGISDYLLERNY